MIAGIDIGGTKIALGMADDNGVVVVREQIPVEVDRGPANARDRIVDILREQVRTTGTRLTGIGIGCTGPVDPVSGEVGDVFLLPGWQGWNPVHELADAFDVTAAMENDADAAALGEARWGIGKGKRSLIGITIGTGIGSGIIFNGELYRGAGHAHPEIGHHIVEPGGPPCGCGAAGCWESLASGSALEHWYLEQNPHESRTGKEIFTLARAGHAPAQQAVKRLARYLGIGLANVVSMMLPEVIALSGSVVQSADLLMDDIRAIVRNHCRIVPAENCTIAVSSLGWDAGLLGAIQVWHNRFSLNIEGKS